MSEITLIEKIKNDAAKAVEEIKSAALTEVESIQREIEAEVTELNKTYATALEKAKAHMELVSISKAKQAGNIAKQSAKRTQIDTIFSAVVDDLEGQSGAEYVAFFERHAKEIVPKEAEVSYVNAPLKREEETKKILKNLGFSGEVKADPAIKAGLVIYTKEGVYDATLTRLMNERRDELEMVVVNKVMS